MLHSLLVGPLAAAGPVLCPCDETVQTQFWALEMQHVTTVSRNSTCLGVGNLTSQALVTDCAGPMPNATKAWIIDFLPGQPPQTQFSWDYDTSLCLTALQPGTAGSRLDVEPCNGSRPEQTFSFGIADGHLINAHPPFPPTVLCVNDADSCA